MEFYSLEKLKTIGDSYMCASGIPVSKYSQIVGAKDAVDIVLAGKDFSLGFLAQSRYTKIIIAFTCYA